MRAYAITFDSYEAQGGSFKYAIRPRKERKSIFYGKGERDDFIKFYEYLIDPSNDLYFDNIKCHVAEFREIKDMEAVINAI